MTAPGPGGRRVFDRSLYSSRATDPLVREVREARKEGSSIEQIARIWRFDVDDVKLMLSSGRKSAGFAQMRARQGGGKGQHQT